MVPFSLQLVKVDKSAWSTEQGRRSKHQSLHRLVNARFGGPKDASACKGRPALYDAVRGDDGEGQLRWDQEAEQLGRGVKLTPPREICIPLLILNLAFFHQSGLQSSFHRPPPSQGAGRRLSRLVV